MVNGLKKKVRRFCFRCETFLLFSFVVIPGILWGDTYQVLPTPPQDQGLPYTRSAHTVAREKIKNHLFVFAPSRYAYIRGIRVRVDAQDLIHGETFLENNSIYVPKEFIGALTVKGLNPDPIPRGLELLTDRWVHVVTLPQIAVPEGVSQIVRGGRTYVDLEAAAKALGLVVSPQPRPGLCVVGADPLTFKKEEADVVDDIVTLFDTPEKLADPEIATRNIPTLKQQGPWQNHIKASPEATKLYEGPETVWPTVPENEYNLEGFNATLLGSKIPPPDVYPRLLFSPEDIPAIRKRLESNVIARMSLIEIEELLKRSWWDPSTSDGQAFERLIKGDFKPEDGVNKEGASVLPGSLAGQKQGIYNSHIVYISNCLTTMAFYCLITGDEVHGKQAATAMANYLTHFSEPLIDQALQTSDSEFGTKPGGSGETAWRGMCGLLPHCDYAFMLDFGGKWMTPEQRQAIQRLIAKAIYGRRDTHQAGPVAWRENNHATWHTTNFLGAMAIEGCPGCDPELFPAAKEHVRAFLDYGIDAHGQIFESNGKNGGGINFEILNMVALARRGDNLWGHPHLRKLLQAQVQCTSPDGKVTVSSGTFSGSRLTFQCVGNLKAFFPEDKCADYLLTQQNPDLNLAQVNLENYRQLVHDNKVPALRLPGPTYSGFTRSVLYDTDWKVTALSDLSLPLVFNDDIHGVFSVYSDKTPQATWMNLHVRSNQYYGAGHHHNDAGMFHFSALGVNWFEDCPYLSMAYDGKVHNEVLVDGKAEADDAWNAPGVYKGAKISSDAGFASCDLGYAYSWQWKSQFVLWDAPEMLGRDWELETHPQAIKYFKGTQHWKMRPWWPSYNYANWNPVLRAKWNPMEYVYRTVGVVRGEHPYGLIIDDLKKDDQAHDYIWGAAPDKKVWNAEIPDLPAGWSALAVDGAKAKTKLDPKEVRPKLNPATGDPVLLICPLGLGTKDSGIKIENDGPRDREGKVQFYERFNLGLHAVKAQFRILLLPIKLGEKIPHVTYDRSTQVAEIQFGTQIDKIIFNEATEHQTLIEIKRGDKTLITTK